MRAKLSTFRRLVYRLLLESASCWIPVRSCFHMTGQTSYAR